MATEILEQHTLGVPFNGTVHNTNLQAVEDSLADLGPLIISGLVPSAGAGLTVSVTAGVASIGGRLTAAGSFNITGLTDATTNHLYLLNTGAGTSNTSGTQPANSVKLGTALTAAGVVSSVATNWTAGRQTKRRTEDLIHGSGAGHPRAVDLSSWHATNNEGNETKGTLAAGSLSSAVFLKNTDQALDDGVDIAVGSSSGTKIATATTQKLAFFNSTPIVQPANTTDLRQALIDLGLLATGGATPLNLNGGDLTVNAATINADSTLADGVDIAAGTTTGTKIGTVGGASGQKFGFFGATPVVQPLLATGGGATVDDVITALQTLGLVRQS